MSITTRPGESKQETTDKADHGNTELYSPVVAVPRRSIGLLATIAPRSRSEMVS